jgi:hypothetical protein
MKEMKSERFAPQTIIGLATSVLFALALIILLVSVN